MGEIVTLAKNDRMPLEGNLKGRFLCVLCAVAPDRRVGGKRGKMEKLHLDSPDGHKVLAVRSMTLAAVLGVVSYLFMLVRFPLPFLPPFMDFDLAAVPELMGTFLQGPTAGIFTVLVKLLIKIATTGSTSAMTGEIINFILSCSYILPAWFFYAKFKDRRHAVYGMIASTATVTAVACFANIYLIIPLFAKLYGFDMNAVVAMSRAVNRYIDSVPRLVMFGIAPFNLIKYGVSAFIVYILYDRTVRVFKMLERR
jgi:riboflavin transporter FmnP